MLSVEGTSSASKQVFQGHREGAIPPQAGELRAPVVKELAATRELLSQEAQGRPGDSPRVCSPSEGPPGGPTAFSSFSSPSFCHFPAV